MARNLRPVGDRILVESTEQKQDEGIIIPDTAKEKSMESVILALGTGKMGDNGKKIPFEVKAGDHVLVNKSAGAEVKLDGKGYKILTSDDILAVID
jgi:chaperonin GroES